MASRLAAGWEVLSWRGVGRKASAGLGAFELEGGPEPCTWLEVGDGHNGFVSLSHFVPARKDPREGLWRVHVKNPKFASTHVVRFLKGNLVTLVPGSRFRTEGRPAPFYGRILPMNRD
jgi:CRISPR/Cas system CSM-associated protein Csm4 (group 5 of RAMP superfamily)